MTSMVTVYATSEEMDKLFNDTQGKFSIRYYERTEQMEDNSIYRVTVRHGDNIGYQDGKTFDYQSFLSTFDDLKLNERRSGDSYFLDSDMEMAKKGLEGGLSTKMVAQILKIYGSSQCADTKYVKALMKSEKIQELVNQMKNKEKILGLDK